MCNKPSQRLRGLESSQFCAAAPELGLAGRGSWSRPDGSFGCSRASAWSGMAVRTGLAVGDGSPGSPALCAISSSRRPQLLCRGESRFREGERQKLQASPRPGPGSLTVALSAGLSGHKASPDSGRRWGWNLPPVQWPLKNRPGFDSQGADSGV